MKRRWQWKHHGSKFFQMKERGRNKKRIHPAKPEPVVNQPVKQIVQPTAPPKFDVRRVESAIPKKVGWLRRLFQRRVG